MKHLYQLVLGLVLVSALTIRAADSSSGNSQEVLAAMNAFKQAVANKDRGALDKLMHPDLTYTHSSGKTETKAEAIEGIVGGKGSQSIDFSESKVRVYNGTALVTGKVTMQPSMEGKPGTPFLLVISHVWLKSPHGWQLVDRQATRPAPAP